MDFLMKPVDRETLLQAVTAAIARSVDLRVLRDELRHRRTCYQTLTKREVEVFERVVAGKMNKEIANELGAAERTIKAHRARMIQKMQVSSVAELVRFAIQLARDPAQSENTDRTPEGTTDKAIHTAMVRGTLHSAKGKYPKAISPVRTVY